MMSEQVRYTRYADIPKASRASWKTDLSWKEAIEKIQGWQKTYTVDLDPDFQRGHVWSTDQQVAYLEFILKGGITGQDIFFNCPYWMGSRKPGTLTLVDGKQRLTAISNFLTGGIPVFNSYVHEYTDTLQDTYLTFHMNKLETRAELLQWYLDLNQGVAHTPEELIRVKKLLEEAK